MSKYAITMLLAATLLLLVACTAGGTETAVTPAQEQPAMENTSTANTEESAAPQESAPETQVSEPVTVDLGELTPLPPANTTPVEAPAPGIPNPLVKLEQDVKLDLAGQLDLDISAIKVVSSTAVTWRDGSLGCPQPDMMYTQALVPGYRIVLQVDGREYAYHTNDSGYFILCNNPDPNGAINPES